jgi:cytochrome P450
MTLDAPFFGGWRRSPTKGPNGDALSHLPGQSGFLAGVANAVGWARRGRAHLTAQARRYGSIYRHQLPSIGPIVCVADADSVAAILRNEDGLWSTEEGYRIFFDGIDPGRDTLGLVGLDSDRHKDARKFLQPAFGPQAMAGYIESATKLYEEAIAKWLARGRVAFGPAVRRLFAAVADCIFMGIDDPGEAAMLDTAVEMFWRGGRASPKNALLSRAWRNAIRGHRILRETLHARMGERRTNGGTDLFSRMCRAGGEVPWIDDDMLVRLFISVLVAAFDITAHGATSMAYLLARYPAWQERLRNEALSLGRGHLEYDHMKRLEQCEWVWKETLRLYPAIGFLPRRAMRDTELAGRRIPGGTKVLALLATLLHDPAWWTSPESFDPERFAPDRAEDKKHRGAFLPFGAGAHTCLGLQLASVQIKVFWHALLTQCRIRLARDYRARHGFSPVGSVSGDVKLVLEPCTA